jgi:hypothetical protein
MGFTRHWTIKRKLSKRDFRKFAGDCKTVLDFIGVPLTHSTEVTYIASGETKWETTEQASITAEEVRFDAKENSCDTFGFRNEEEHSFCKTASFPYDACVAACLVLAKLHYGDKMEVRADGDNFSENDDPQLSDTANWEEGMRAVEAALGIPLWIRMVPGTKDFPDDPSLFLEVSRMVVEPPKPPTIEEMVSAIANRECDEFEWQEA